MKLKKKKKDNPPHPYSDPLVATKGQQVQLQLIITIYGIETKGAWVPRIQSQFQHARHETTMTWMGKGKKKRNQTHTRNFRFMNSCVHGTHLAEIQADM